jgi:tRNA G10  N-methylase Trm11
MEKNPQQKTSQNTSLLEVLQQMMSPPPPEETDEDKESPSGPRFPADRFFTAWFRTRGTIYSFLFKKNHRVTNIQVAELVALLRSYREDSDAELAFLSPNDFKETMKHVVEAFGDQSPDRWKADEFFNTQYAPMMSNIAVVDVLYGSCMVFLPPGVRIDVASVCALSGYIHSYGINVYIRNIYKATKEEFFKKLHRYLKGRGPNAKKVLFRPYSHEDFSDNDRLFRNDLKSGLDDVKLSVQKSFLRDSRIADMIEEMRTEFAETLVIPYPGDSRVDVDLIDGLRSKNEIDPNQCLFLIIDHSVESTISSRGDRHFIICFDQHHVNRNPFHLFDENKPAWFDHTTLPHTLAGAMINISRPYWPKQNGPITICDCFVGGGTTLLEASKFENIECYGLDYEPISPLLVEDNLHVFAAPASELNSYIGHLSRIVEHLEDPSDPKLVTKYSWESSTAGKSLGKAEQLIRLWEDRRVSRQAPEASDELVVALRGDGMLLPRLIFYTKLKVARRYERALAEKSVNPNQVLKSELEDLTEMLEQLSDLRGLSEGGVTKGGISRYLDAYSEGLTLSRTYLRTLASTLPGRISVVNCEIWEPDTRFDLIISDPPYGFNTDQDAHDLAILYDSFLKKAIGALTDSGQLVLALPDWSHTGRRLPAIILKSFVINQVLMIAEAARREVIQLAAQAPQTVGLPPYYWESEKALRRAILHFRFRPRQGYLRGTQGTSYP